VTIKQQKPTIGLFAAPVRNHGVRHAVGGRLVATLASCCSSAIGTLAPRVCSSRPEVARGHGQLVGSLSVGSKGE
jgi:hypothetical protein